MHIVYTLLKNIYKISNHLWCNFHNHTHLLFYFVTFYVM